MMVVGCREYARAVDVKPDGSLLFRDVPADTVVAWADPACPADPVRWCEVRLRVSPKGTGDAVWTWDVFDISDPKNPTYSVHLDEEGKPGELYSEPSEYGWRYADGTPFIPRVLYHARVLGDRLWDAWEGVELVEGSKSVAVMHSMLLHCVFDASWPDREAVNLRIAGAGVQGASKGVVSDPSVVHMWEVKDPEAGQPFFYQFSPSMDIEKLERVITRRTESLAVDAGIDTSDIQRMGTARSGAAISLSNEGKRTQQRRFVPHFSPADVDLVTKAAACLNRFAGQTLPESGWTVSYPEIPLSPEEQKARRDDVIELLDKGLISPTTAYQRLNPGTTKAQAEQALLEIARSRALLGS